MEYLFVLEQKLQHWIFKEIQKLQRYSTSFLITPNYAALGFHYWSHLKAALQNFKMNYKIKFC